MRTNEHTKSESEDTYLRVGTDECAKKHDIFCLSGISVCFDGPVRSFGTGFLPGFATGLTNFRFFFINPSERNSEGLY